MKILLIEDDETLRQNLTQALMADGYEVQQSADGEEGLYLIQQAAPDAVVLDRMLPKLDGLSVLRAARRASRVPVLLLTAMDAVGDRVDGLDAGADDYLTKPFDMRELLARVRALCRRPAGYEQGDTLHFGDLCYTPSGLLLQGPGGETQLSRRLAQLYEALLRCAPSPLSREGIYNRVWGPGSDVEEGIIDTYVRLLRRRLNEVGSTVRLANLHGVGFALQEGGA